VQFLRSKIADGLWLLVLGLIIFSCQQAKKSVEVTFWHAMGGPLGKTLDAMIADFEQEHPNIKIKSVGMGDYSALAQKLMGAISVQSPPTIAQVYESWTTQFYQQNQILPIDSLIKGPNGLAAADLADIYPVFIEDNTWDGKLLTFPFNKSVPVYFYNIKMFEQNGIKEFPKTWEEFRTVCKKLTKDANGDGTKDIWGTGGGINAWLFGCMLLQKGGSLLDEKTNTPIFNSPAGIDALQYLVDLVYKDSTQNFVLGYEPQNDFLAQKLALIWGTSVSWAFMQDKMNFEVGLAPIPKWDKPAVLSYGTNIAIFRKAKPEALAAAWEFIRWFTNTKNQARWAAATFYCPIRRSSLQEPALQKLLREIKGLNETLAQLDYATFEPRGEEWFAGRRYLGEALESAMRLKQTPKQALDDAAKRVEKEIKK
jgi:multiple sugar transport system substrate-binding protein